MELSRIKRLIRPFVPVAVIEGGARRHEEFKKQREIDRYLARRRRLEGLQNAVGDTIATIDALTDEQCINADYLEHVFIPSIGLNDEILHEQPPELSPVYGKGLHIWQYPNQLANYLVWLARNAADITSYMEIGCRWGGMFILISEWIRKNGGRLHSVTAVDPIDPSPFVLTWFKLLRDRSDIEATYIQEFSTSDSVRRMVDRIRPDMVFIDGDHTLRGALADHMLVRDHARIIAHHDIHSQAWPDTTFLWRTLKELEARDFDFFDFVDQYSSVEGNFLGIGAMKRKA